jgi:hypothetical protein
MKPVFKYPLIASALVIALKLVVVYAHMQLTPFGIFLGIFSFILMAVPIFLALKNRRDNELGGFLTVKQAMGTGMFFSIITGIIVGIFIYVFSSYIDHETTPLILKKIEENLRAANASPAEIETELTAQKDFYSPFNQALKGGLISVLVFGFILSFICSMFVMKNPPAQN